MNVAVIGLGEMGSMIVSRFIKHGLVLPSAVYVYDRNTDKREALEQTCPGIHAEGAVIDAVRQARYIFICVQPPHIPALLKEIKPYLKPEANLFISSSNVVFKEAEALYDGKISKFLPTVNSAIDRGVIYAAHNQKVTDGDADFFRRIMTGICGRFYEIQEPEFALLNNLAGCAPAFLACFCEYICKAVWAMQERFSYREIEEMFTETFAATGQRIAEQHMGFEQIVCSVGKPGGITDTALGAFREALPAVAEDLVQRSVQRHEEIDWIVSKGFRQQAEKG